MTPQSCSPTSAHNGTAAPHPMVWLIDQTAGEVFDEKILADETGDIVRQWARQEFGADLAGLSAADAAHAGQIRGLFERQDATSAAVAEAVRQIGAHAEGLASCRERLDRHDVALNTGEQTAAARQQALQAEFRAEVSRLRTEFARQVEEAEARASAGFRADLEPLAARDRAAHARHENRLGALSRQLTEIRSWATRLEALDARLDGIEAHAREQERLREARRWGNRIAAAREEIVARRRSARRWFDARICRLRGRLAEARTRAHT